MFLHLPMDFRPTALEIFRRERDGHKYPVTLGLYHQNRHMSIFSRIFLPIFQKTFYTLYICPVRDGILKDVSKKHSKAPRRGWDILYKSLIFEKIHKQTCISLVYVLK